MIILFRYGATVYICKTDLIVPIPSTGLEPDIAKWEVFATGLDFKGDWSKPFDYKANDRKIRWFQHMFVTSIYFS